MLSSFSIIKRLLAASLMRDENIEGPLGFETSTGIGGGGGVGTAFIRGDASFISSDSKF